MENKTIDFTYIYFVLTEKGMEMVMKKNVLLLNNLIITGPNTLRFLKSAEVCQVYSNCLNMLQAQRYCNPNITFHESFALFRAECL